MKKKGISLITLVITIVVVIILAAAVILALGQNNPINSSRVATIVQTKDSIQSGILMYSSNIKAKTLGELSTEEILINNDNYKIVDGATATITETSVEKTLNKIDSSKAREKLNVEIKEETNAAWYVDITGKTYLVYNDKSSIPNYLMENDEVLGTVSSFVTYAGSITNTPSPSPTIGYLAGDIKSMTEEQKQSVIGKRVELTSINGWNDWKVFSTDGTNIVLIAGDYVNITNEAGYFPSTSGFETDNSYNDSYCINSTTSREDLLSKLTTENTYAGFKDLAGKVKEARIPKIEDFALSYNCVLHIGKNSNNDDAMQKIYYKNNGKNGGYNVSPETETIKSNDDVPESEYWAGYFSTEDLNYGELWTINDTTKAQGYWLATPSSYADIALLYVYDGTVNYHFYNYNYCALRPIVVLNSNVKLVPKGEGTNITYTLE